MQELPAPLQESFRHFFERFREATTDVEWQRFEPFYRDEEFARHLARVWSGSEFVAECCIRRPALFVELLEDGHLKKRLTAVDYRRALADHLNAAADESEIQRVLRLFRQREMLRIVWRDLTRTADLWQTTEDMTALAEACLEAALAVLYPKACQIWGEPVGSDSGEYQQLVVLGMGKLGARELNVSSDIDLIFAYPESGETRGARRSLSNQEFFTRLGQQMIAALDSRTADGFVFRVDMRLRPYGQSGALVLNFDAMEEYYQTQGRDWERYAMIKARVVAGDERRGKELLALLRPFTYRKYVDYSAVQSLRNMKELINREVRHRGLQDNVKLGVGGIREIEFICQAFQLIRGGRDRRFQNPSLKKILTLLAEENLLPADTAADLEESYIFLRNLEHVLQAWRDKQTQTLPTDEMGCQRVATLMGFSDWEAFSRQLSSYRQRVHRVFSDVASGDDDRERNRSMSPVEKSARELWLDPEGDDPVKALEVMGYDEPETVQNQLRALRQSRAVLAMTNTARERLHRLMPLLLVECAAKDYGANTFSRILSLVEAVVRRSAYLTLLVENPAARGQLLRLFTASSWIADQLCRMPALLDELLDLRALYSPLEKDGLRNDLNQLMLNIPEDNIEAHLETLRYFRYSHGLRIAACEVAGIMPLMKVSDYLTWIAEAILEQVSAMVWQQMEVRYGKPGTGDGVGPGLLVVGYGKLGGIELGHASDLDLVFLHDADSNLVSDGAKSIDNATYFTRFGQMIIHFLTTQTASGSLYEVDMRLRPSGNSGLLVSSIEAFEKYQKNQAWTWEHQALVRARALGGSESLTEEFNRVRREVLCRQRDEARLRGEVREMREKMRRHLDKSDDEKFSLKQGPGGIVDIEFMVQYAVLAKSHKFSELTQWSDNIRLLEKLGEYGVYPRGETEKLTEIFMKYRSAVHSLQLQGQTALVPTGEFLLERQEVIRLWQSHLGEGNDVPKMEPTGERNRDEET